VFVKDCGTLRLVRVKDLLSVLRIWHPCSTTPRTQVALLVRELATISQKSWLTVVDM